ncbi:MAG TPA: DNA double-strand break repair nuclease NurA [Ktedonobacterales bacterium]
MLYTEKLVAELERKRALFSSYDERYGQQRETWREALAALGTTYPTAAVLRQALDAALVVAGGSHAAGALPTNEYDRWRATGRSGPPVLPFGHAFAHHEESRVWAEGMRGTTTFAVDGSQLLPWRDASVPVALVQAGIFENPHQPPTPYLKDVRTELLPPEDLLVSEPEMVNVRTNEAAGYSERIVHLRRFELEVDTLVQRLEHHAARRRDTQREPTTPVIALFDGSLIVSFAIKMPPPYPERYAAAAKRLLDASHRTRIPLLGYIDTSYARDTITMLRTLSGDELPPARGIHDALLWGDALSWGDRTPAFISAREDLSAMGYRGGSDAVAFVYLRAAGDRPPARVEFPAWLLEDGQLDQILDILRAEIIIGQGYPYSIEAADAVAVITAEDRARFYALFQQFAEREGLAFTFSRKALSKSRRRV